LFTVKTSARTLAFTAVGVVLAFTLLVILARWMRGLPDVASFMATYPGTTPLPDSAPVGIPAWLAWQHFFNAFLLLLIIRTGWIIRSKKRPPAFWTRSDAGLLKYTGPQRRMGIFHWFHLSLDTLWVLNGVVYIALLFITGQWMRIVPTSWAIFPNAVTAALRYASLDWPTDYGWVNYNSLQVLAYFTTVFIAAPLAIKTGLRLSPAWPQTGWLARAFPEKLGRRLHVWVLFYFVLFIVVHVTLVLATGVLRNLNVMYAAQDGEGWLGVILFALSLAAMVVGWMLARPPVLKALARLSGTVQG
jgi:thiosulfate reductase cytochrome b subunit